MGSVTLFSPAKINLTLAVGPLRADGFHPLESIVSRLDFGDRVTLTARPDDRIIVECDAAGIPKDETNLAVRAAVRLREEIAASCEKRVSGVTIRLEKSIPAGAGLGGGSSNAAATLRGLRQLWNVDIPASRIAAIGAEIGSDVALFLAEPERLIIMRGRGEQIELLGHSLLSVAVLLAIPPIHSPTGPVYRRFDELPPPPVRPPAQEIIAALQTADGHSSLDLFNDLQAAAEDLNPSLRDFREQIERIAGQNFLMTGSGAAYFTRFAPADAVRAERALTALRDAAPHATFLLTRMI